MWQMQAFLYANNIAYQTLSPLKAYQNYSFHWSECEE
jgi:hypothetical protein